MKISLSIKNKMFNISLKKILNLTLISLFFLFLYYYFPLLLKIISIILLIIIVPILLFILYLKLKPQPPSIPWTEEDGLKYENIHYSNENPKQNSYDIYIPKNSNNKKNLALVLFIHGGAWILGDKKDYRDDCKKLAKKGYITATLDYSLLKKVENENSASIPKIMSDIKLCISHICQFTNKKNFNITQFAISGYSAGGHLAMLFAYSQKNFEIPLRFISIKAGPVDLNLIFKTEKNKLEKLEKNLKNNKLDKDDIKTKNDIDNVIFGCSGKIYENGNYHKDEIDELIAYSSPLKYINENSIVPAIFVFADKDDIVTPLHYEKLIEKYKKFNGKYELIIFPNSGHFLLHDPDKIIVYEETLIKWCKEYFGY